MYRKITIDDYEFMRHEDDGDLTQGFIFVDENGFIRWLSVEDIAKMQGEGNYSGATGYPAYHKQGES